MSNKSENNYEFCEMEEYLSKYDGDRPGVALIAKMGDEIIYRKNVGLANLEYNIPITSNTVFNLASISKPITAMAIMILMEDKKLDYDNEITEYFPELSHYCKGVTIRHLLSHTSGITNYYRILDRLGMTDIHLTNEQCYELLKKEEKLLFKPGERWNYSNSNYVLLAKLIEIVSNTSLDIFLHENIFKPLGMSNAMVFNERQPIVKNRAYGYGCKEGYFFCDYIGPFTTGDGCVFASVEDLVAFEQALYTEKLVSKDTIKEAFTPGIDNEFGLGWETWKSTPELQQIHHSGEDHGTKGLFVTYPQHRLTIIMLANFNEFMGKDMAYITNYFVEKIVNRA